MLRATSALIACVAVQGAALGSEPARAANAKFVDQHNARFTAGLETYALALNQFANLSSTEWQEVYLRRGGEAVATGALRAAAPRSGGAPPPPTLDWRTDGVVGPVPNQGACAADWAFAAVGAIQSAAAIKRGGNGHLIALSSQVRPQPLLQR